MAITLRNLTIGPSVEMGGKTPWAVDASSADVTGLEILKAEPSSGDLYLESISLECPSMAAGEWVKIQNDGTVILHLLGDAGGGLVYSEYFENPIKFTGNIKIDQEAADPIHVLIEGFTA